MQNRIKPIESNFIEDEPYYLPSHNEVNIFTEAYRNHLPVLLKGPTDAAKPDLWSIWHGASNGPF